MGLDPTLATIAEDDFDFLLPQLTEKQPEILEAEGFYLQALGQPNPLPAEGETGTPDPSATRPSDRPTSLADWGVTYRADTPVRTSVFETRASCMMVGMRKICIESGWSIYQEVMSEGSLWTRQIIVEGPGESRPWAEDSPFPPGGG